MNKYLLLLPIIIAIGAQLGTIITPYFLIFFIIGAVLFSSKIPTKYYPMLIFSITLSLMYQATMVGVHVIGSDSHQEFYVSNQVGLFNWHPTGDYGTQSSSSFVVGSFVPIFSWITHIPIAYVYKAVLPIFFAFTPVILYFVFAKQFDKKIAFLSALFFMAVPVATLEIAQIGKSMVAETFFALMLWAMFSNLSDKKKFITVFSCALLACLAHYTVGFVAVCFLLSISSVRLVTNWNKYWIFSRPVVPVSILIAAVLVSILSLGYYSKAADGVVFDVVKNVGPQYADITTDTVSHVLESDANKKIKVGEGPSQNKNMDINNTDDSSKFGYLDEQAPLVKTAIGMDFFDASNLGKIFRLLQYLTQFLIILGALYLIKNWNKLKCSTEYLIGVGVAFVLLLFCIFVPHFSSIINITRFYHLALFFLSPMFVIGGLWILRNMKVIAIVFICYFIFTSGFMFEATKSNAIDDIEIPYSIGLSAERTGVTSTYMSSDVDAAKWLIDKSDQSLTIVSDYNGYRLMMGYMPIFPRLRDGDYRYLPSLGSLPDKPCYILVTSWSTRHDKYITDVTDKWESAGMRQGLELPIFDYPIVYQKGDTVVYKKD